MAFVASLITGGVRDAVISPGSRHTPLVMALVHAASQGSQALRLHTVIDERIAGFFALGIARMTGRVVLLACTSGSAGTHYFPAIVEASRSRIPLLIVTADRPAELQNCGAPQTMDQAHLYGTHARAFFHLEAPTGDQTEAFQGTALNAIEAAAGTPPGPVQVNMAFAKPLWEAGTAPALPTNTRREAQSSPTEVDASWGDKLAATPRGVFLWGDGELGATGRPYHAAHAQVFDLLREASALLGWPVITDTTAGLAGPSAAFHGHIRGAELLFTSEEWSTWSRPDLIVRLGGAPTTRLLSQWSGASPTLLVDPSGWRRDPSKAAIGVAHCDPAAFLRSLISTLRTRQAPSAPCLKWIQSWEGASRVAADASAPLCSGDPLWAGSIVHVLGRELPDGALIHIASSLAIRSVATFLPFTGRDVVMTANRGVNGIDGTLATSAGQASAWPHGPVTTLIGDVACLHDVGSLAALDPAQPHVILVVDNGGGGIFDHLPVGEAGEPFERHYITPPPFPPDQLAQGFGVEAQVAHSASNLQAALRRAYAAGGRQMVVARIDRDLDLRLHKDVWRSTQRALDTYTEGLA